MNTKLLKQVANRILKYPEKYDQDAICGSSCCIAGHICLIKDGLIPHFACDSIARADEILSLHRFNNLFCFSIFWPEPFRTQYAKAKTAKGRARVGYRRIMAFIKSGGKT